MKFKLIILLFITSLFSLNAQEDQNFFLGFGSSFTNHTLKYDRDKLEEVNIAVLDLLFHSSFGVSYESFNFDNNNFSLLSKLTLSPFRLTGDMSVSVAYRADNFQLFAGPLLIYDQYFPVVKTFFNISNALGKYNHDQYYWLYVGAEIGCRYFITDNMGISLDFKQSFADISHLFIETDKDFKVDNFYLLNLNFFIRLKDGI